MNPKAWDDEDTAGLDEEPDDEDEDAIAARAVIAWTEIEGNDELSRASREALVLIAQEALAKKEARRRREAAARRAEAQRVAESRAEWSRVVPRDQAERWEAERRARDERLAAVARNHAEPSVERQVDRRRASPGHREVAPAVRVPSLVSAHPEGRATTPVPVARWDPDEHHGEPDEDDAAQEVGWEAFDAPRTSDPPEAPVRYLFAADVLSGVDLAAWRAQLGLTQQAAADRLGVRQGTVSKAESRGGEALGAALREALAAEIERG
jgi:hypothetical protein